MPSPHCMRPAALPRAWSGHSSAVIDEPVAHSEPMATPTRKRNATNDIQSHASALRPVMTE